MGCSSATKAKCIWSGFWTVASWCASVVDGKRCKGFLRTMIHAEVNIFGLCTCSNLAAADCAVYRLLLYIKCFLFVNEWMNEWVSQSVSQSIKSINQFQKLLEKMAYSFGVLSKVFALDANRVQLKRHCRYQVICLVPTDSREPRIHVAKPTTYCCHWQNRPTFRRHFCGTAIAIADFYAQLSKVNFLECTNLKVYASHRR